MQKAPFNLDEYDNHGVYWVSQDSLKQQTCRLQNHVTGEACMDHLANDT